MRAPSLAVEGVERADRAVEWPVLPTPSDDNEVGGAGVIVAGARSELAMPPCPSIPSIAYRRGTSRPRSTAVHLQALLEDVEVGGERGHVVAVVRQRDAAERGHGARDLRLGEEAEEAEHGEAAVVDLDEAAALLLLGGGVLREADRVPARKSKVSLVRSVAVVGGERAAGCDGLILRAADLVERHRVRDLVLVAGLRRIERGERARLAALGVVGAAGTDSEKNSRKPTKRTICHLPASGTWSQSSAGDLVV